MPHPAPSWRASAKGCVEHPEPEQLPFHPLRHRVSDGRASFDLSNCDIDGVCQKRMEERHYVLVLLWATGGSEMEFLGTQFGFFTLTISFSMPFYYFISLTVRHTKNFTSLTQMLGTKIAEIKSMLS